MTHYLNGFVPDIECKRCDGNGWIEQRNPRLGRGVYQEDCPDCHGHGWRPMTQDEMDDAAADAFSDMCEGEPPVTMQERYQAAHRQKREAHG